MRDGCCNGWRISPLPAGSGYRFKVTRDGRCEQFYTRTAALKFAYFN